MNPLAFVRRTVGGNIDGVMFAVLAPSCLALVVFALVTGRLT